MKSDSFFSTRRSFMLGCGAFGLTAGAAGIDIAPKDTFKDKVSGRRLKIASVGCGGMGRSATESLISAGCDLVAVCDIDPSAFGHWEKKYPGIPKFTDYHARTVEECELMLKTSLRTGRVVQMGNQGHPGVWRYKALRDANAWGEIKAIYSWSDRPIWPQGMTKYAKAEPLPANFAKNAWDCWCGPSADHGYSPAYHRFKWRGWWDYGCGAIGDMAVHNADPAFWTFELGLPAKVKADTFGGPAVDVAYPRKSSIEMEFLPNKWIPKGVKLVWTDGGVKPSADNVPGLAEYAASLGAAAEAKKAEKAKKEGKPYKAPAKIASIIPGNGLIVVGTKATTIGESHAAKPVCIAGDKAAVNAAIAKGDKASKYNHYREFVEACLAGDLERCGSKLSYAAPLTEALLIGCIALRFPGESLEFSRRAMRFTNKPEANKFLKAPKRGDWVFKGTTF